MPLRAKFSLLLCTCVVLSVFSSAAVLSRFFTADQKAYLADFQSSTALSYQRQLELRMRLLHAQLGTLLSSEGYAFDDVVGQVSGARYGELWESTTRIAAFPEHQPERPPVPGKGIWSLERLPGQEDDGVLRWIGRYAQRTLVLDLSQEWFEEIFVASHGTVARLVAGDGSVLLSSESAEARIGGAELFDNRSVAAEMLGGQVGLARTRTYQAADGAEWMATFVPLGTEPPLMIVAGTPLSMVRAVIERTYRHSAFVAAICLLLAIIVGMLFAGTLTSPLRALVDQTIALAQGNFQATAVGQKRNDEVGRLARAFSQMASQLEKAKNELKRAERLAAFGRFSSSIAHEIKNPLSSILGNAQVARRAISNPQELDLTAAGEALGFVEEETRRANRIVNRLLKFARQDQRPTSVIDVVALVRRSSQIVKPVIEGAGIELETRFPTGVVGCVADGDQLHEVILNLVQNAVHAVRGAEVKRILIELAAGDQGIVLRVADTGQGIAPEVREHLFEPFFTTKPLGQGTGLGLAVCHGIVLNHGGSIEVISAPGEGADFRVHLPAAATAPGEKAA